LYNKSREAELLEELSNTDGKRRGVRIEYILEKRPCRLDKESDTIRNLLG